MTAAVSANSQKLRSLLQEMFRLDQADLDFGIYRIMNQKRDEILRFLDNDLLPQVKQAFESYRPADRAYLQGQLDEAIRQANALGVDPDQTAKVRALRQRLADAAVDVTALENAVFSHLTSFFRRYYSEGDFISLRRYKEGVYAIPYEGEEVKLHWANADQYYVKSTETFRDYTFLVVGGKRVRIHLVAASTEQGNNKEASGKERRFVPCTDKPLQEEDAELFIRFEYRPAQGKQKQDDLNRQAVATILQTKGFDAWTHELAKPAPSGKNRDRTVLEKHLTQYTAKNTFDYFIHKNLGVFLRRELDFYIKNELMHLDDIENEAEPKVEQYLSLIRVIRLVARKIIAFLDQLENFQKKLWLKKKFVTETRYCVRLDLVPEKLYPEVAKNHAQREEWVRLFGINEATADLTRPGYGEPLTPAFLKANPTLVLDTLHFRSDFTLRLLGSLGDLDRLTDGVLFRSENFQALALMQARYKGKIKCVYIDPPYNSKTTEIAYKNTYKHSSWLALMDGRLRMSRPLTAHDGSHVVAIDENEQEVLGQLLGMLFPGHEKVCVAVIHNKKGIQGDYFSYNHEYAFFCIPPDLPATNGTPIPESEWDFDNLRKWGRESERATARNCFYPIVVQGKEIVAFGDVCDEDFHPGTANLTHGKRTLVYPVDSQGIERKWRYARDSVESIRPLLKVHVVSGSGEIQIHKAKAERTVKTVWDDPKYIAGDYGTKWLTDLGLKIRENLYPKSIHTVEDALFAVSDGDSLILDYFAGSGTTGHAAISLNRRDGGRRKFILAEVGHYFDTVLVPRLKKVTFTPMWKDGKPRGQPSPEDVERGPRLLKVMHLESYEDALNNLELKRTEEQGTFLGADSTTREQYILSYMLDVESRGSQSLLNIDGFRNPDQYKLRVERDGETQLVNVDLVETFNWLLGLAVKHIDVIRGVRIVEGKDPEGRRVLVLWRNVEEMDNDRLDVWFKEQGYGTRDLEYDLVYVNGDNNLENLRRPDQTWKVRLIEEEFQRLMFDVQDV